jgi:hypothetical protein
VKKAVVIAAVLVLAATGRGQGEGYVAPKFGIWFPSIVQGLDHYYRRTAWNFGLEWGGLGDAGIGAGAHFDMLWKWTDQPTRFDWETTVIDTLSNPITAYEVDWQVRRTAFSVGGDLVIDPLREKTIHPVVRGSVGSIMMIYINRRYPDDVFDLPELTEHSGVYWGMRGRAGCDLHFNLSDGTSAFIGAEYQWSTVTKRKWGTRTRYRQDLSGVGLRVGFRFL